MSLSKHTMPNRRDVLLAAGAFPLISGCKTLPNRQITDIGIQLYSLREALDEDFVGTLKMVKEVGYDYVELYSPNYTDRSPSDLKFILEDVGLPSPIMHVDYDALSERPSEIVEIASELDCQIAVLPWIPSDQRQTSDYRRHAEMLNRAGEALKSAELTVGYHNHQFEFFDLGGSTTGMDILLTETDADLVTFELDLFWTALAGVDIVEFFATYPGRFKMCHIKDLKGDASGLKTSMDYTTIVGNHMANVGEGSLPFERYFAAKDISGMQYFIVEHDSPPRPFRQAIETSYRNIRDMRF